MNEARRTLMITGGNSGLGLATARVLADRGARVILACRNADTAERARADLAVTAGDRVISIPLDLGDLSSVSIAAEATGKIAPEGIDALICNAGLQIVTGLQKTTDGVEATFAANHLGHFALSRALLPSMTPGGRIVFVASGTHDPRELTGMPAPAIDDLEALARGDAFAGEAVGAAGRRRYTTSKLCNVLCAYELQRRIDASPFAARKVAVVAFDPGLMPATGLSRDYGPAARVLFRCLAPLLSILPNVNRVATSARRLADVATRSDASGLAGRYVSRGKPRRSSAQSYDHALAARLWSLSSRLVGLPDALGEVA